MKSIAELTPAELRQVADLKEQLDRIFGVQVVRRAYRRNGAKRKTRVLTPEGRARIRAALKRRWAKAKRAGRNSL